MISESLLVIAIIGFHQFWALPVLCNSKNSKKSLLTWWIETQLHDRPNLKPVSLKENQWHAVLKSQGMDICNKTSNQADDWFVVLVGPLKPSHSWLYYRSYTDKECFWNHLSHILLPKVSQWCNSLLEATGANIMNRLTFHEWTFIIYQSVAGVIKLPQMDEQRETVCDKGLRQKTEIQGTHTCSGLHTDTNKRYPHTHRHTLARWDKAKNE